MRFPQSIQVTMNDDEENFRGGFNNAPVGLHIVEPTGLIRWVNQAQLDVLGYARKEFVGHHIGEFYVDQDAARAMLHHASNEPVCSYETGLQCRDGSIKQVSIRANVLSADCRFVLARCFVHHTTAKKMVEAQFISLQANFRALLDSTEQGVYGLDVDGRCIFINHVAAYLLGYRSNELVGWRIHEFIHRSRADGSAYPYEDCPTCQQIFRSGSGCSVDGEVLCRRDRTSFPVEYSSSPVLENGVMTGVVVAFTDLTERLQAKAELERSLTQLHSASSHMEAVREEERSRIGREIHDDLGGLLSYLKLDLSRLNKKMDELSLEESGVKLVKRMTSLIEFIDTAITNVQRIASELRPALLDHFGLAAAVIWQVRKFQLHTGIQCKFTESPNVLEVKQEQSILIFRILQEALTNVARHAQAKTVRVDLREEDGNLVLVVQDDGKGISEKAISDPTSFGLLSMRERARLAEGELSVSGIQEKGTTIAVRIPIKRV